MLQQARWRIQFPLLHYLCEFYPSELTDLRFVHPFSWQDSSDFSSFQLDRLMKQSQLSQRLESVRQEMSYSAGGVEDIAENAEDATVESSRLASDDLAHYVLIKGNVDKEDAADSDTATKVAEAAPEDGDVEEEEEWKPGQKLSQCRMNDRFVIRKIERDRHSGHKFAPVCEVKLSSSGSSSDEEDNDKRSDVAKSADVKSSASVAACQSHDDVDNLMTSTVTELTDEKQKLRSPEDVIETKRRKRYILSDSEDEDRSSTDAKSAEENRKLRQPEDVIATKRRKRIESSDSEVEDRSTPVEKSPVRKEYSDVDQKSPAAPVAAETPVPDVQPSTAPRMDIHSQEAVTDKQDKLCPEAESGSVEINAETGEVCYKEPTEGK